MSDAPKPLGFVLMGELTDADNAARIAVLDELVRLRKAVELLYAESTEDQDALIALGVLTMRTQDEKMHDRCDHCPSGDPKDGGDVCCWGTCYGFSWRARP